MQVPPSFAGQSGPCRNCQHVLQIPVQTVADPISFNSASHNPSSGSFPSYPPSAPPSQAPSLVYNSMSSGEGQFESLQIDLKVQHLEQLGQGGMGLVIRVRDQRLGRDAALKILKSEHSSKEMEKRFLREAKITAQLDHPSIPPVYEIGHNSTGDLFLLMRVIEGDTLQKKIRDYHDIDKTPKELRSLLDCLLKVSQAIDYAHSQNIVHRDLKPQNIMVGQFGEVMVMDWGLGKDLSDQESDDFLDEKTKNMTEIEEGEGLTQVGAVMGTLGYMPPEQAGGDPIDQRADIFALGAILTEILTRQVPIAGQSNTNKMVATIKGQIELPCDLDSSVPNELNAIAAEALAPDLEDRMEKTSDFTENLQAYLAGNEVPLHKYSTQEKLKRRAQRHPGLLLGFPIVVTLLTATVSLGIQLKSADRQRLEAEKSAKQSTEDLAKTESELTKTQDKVDESEEALKNNETIAALFKKARESAQKGQSARKIKPRINKALELSGRQFDDLLKAAEIYKEAKLRNFARILLEEASEMKKEPHKALFRLHVLEVEEKHDLSLESEYLQRILTIEKKGKENIYILFAKAHKLFLKREFDKAKSLCSKIEGGNKRLAIVYFLRGRAKMELKDFDSAMSDFQKVIKINPIIATAYFYKALCAGKNSSSPDQALLDFSRCLELKPDHAPSYYYRAEIKQLTNDSKSFREALQDLDRAITHNPNYEAAYRNRVRIKRRFGDIDGCISDYLILVKLNKTDVSSYYRLGGLYKGSGRIQEAYNSYRAAYTIRPNFYEALYYKIKIDHEGKGVVPDCGDSLKFKELNQALKLKAGSKLYTWRANLHDKLGQFDAALADYSSAIKQTRKAREYFSRAKLLAKMGRMEEAKKDIEVATSKDSGYKRKWEKELNKLTQFAQKEAEIKDLTKKLKGTKKDGKKLREIAKLKADQGKTLEALTFFLKATKIDPKSEKAYLDCGKIYNKIGKYKKAVEYLSLSIERKRSDRKAFMERGNAYRSLKQYQNAIEDYSRVLELKSKEKDALEERGKLYLKTRNLKAALKDAKSLIKIDPNRSDAYTLMARTRLRMNDDGGLNDFRKAIELDPDDWKLRREYGYALADLGENRSAMKVMEQLLSRFSGKMSKQDRSRAKDRINYLKNKIRR